MSRPRSISRKCSPRRAAIASQLAAARSSPSDPGCKMRLDAVPATLVAIEVSPPRTVRRYRRLEIDSQKSAAIAPASPLKPRGPMPMIEMDWLLSLIVRRRRSGPSRTVFATPCPSPRRPSGRRRCHSRPRTSGHARARDRAPGSSSTLQSRPTPGAAHRASPRWRHLDLVAATAPNTSFIAAMSR